MTNYIRLTSLIQRMVLTGEIQIGESKVIHYPLKNEKEKQQPQVQVDLTTNDSEFEGQSFSYFSLAVHNAVMTLCEEKTKEFISSDIARILFGDECKRCSKNFLTKIDDELQRLSFVNIYMDLSEELFIQGRGIYGDNGEIHSIDGPILTLEKVPVTQKNGKCIDGYELKETPPFYMYSKNTGQMDTLKIQYNQMKEYGKPTRFAIRELFYDRILLMKSKSGIKSNFNRIGIKTVLEAAEKVAGRKLRLNNVEDLTDALLNDWKDTGLLLNWHKEKDEHSDDFSYLLELNLEALSIKTERVDIGKDKCYGK